MPNGHKTAEAYEMTVLRERGTLRRGIVGADGSVSIVAHSGYPDTFEVWLEWDGRKVKLCSLRLMKNGWQVQSENRLLLAIAAEPEEMSRLAALTEALYRGAEVEAREHGVPLNMAAHIAADHLAENSKAYARK